MTVYAAVVAYGAADDALQFENRAAEKLSDFYLGIASLHIAGAPYDRFSKASQTLRDINWWSDMAAFDRWSHQEMVKSGRAISPSSAKHFARTSGTFVPGTARYAGHSGARILRSRGARVAAKVAGRLVPGLGWALLAYDLYSAGKYIEKRYYNV